jgi:hypothetical protein
VPVTDPSERQALADLLTQLELGVGEPGQEALVEARKSLLETAGQWVYEGETYIKQDPKRWRHNSSTLASEATRALDSGFPHGISTLSKLPQRYLESGEYRSATVQQLTDAGFNVLKTGRNPFHYTVELSQPVTNDVTDLLNGVFGGGG